MQIRCLCRFITVTVQKQKASLKSGKVSSLDPLVDSVPLHPPSAAEAKLQVATAANHDSAPLETKSSWIPETAEHAPTTLIQQHGASLQLPDAVTGSWTEAELPSAADVQPLAVAPGLALASLPRAESHSPHELAPLEDSTSAHTATVDALTSVNRLSDAAAFAASAFSALQSSAAPDSELLSVCRLRLEQVTISICIFFLIICQFI